MLTSLYLQMILGTELSDVEYYVDSARDLVEGLIIELENDKEVGSTN